MSIFPKRSVPGSCVVIHWNFNTSNLRDQHVLPWVRIGVKDPKGKIKMLFEDHVLGLPDPVNDETGSGHKLKYLNKHVPLLLIAEYLSGAIKRERLVEILQNIQSGRHYYFTYSVPEDAPLGKYELISEIHVNGYVKYSNTATDDFFYVEKITCENVNEDARSLVIRNHSTEKTPVKIVKCLSVDDGKMKTAVDVFEMEPLADLELTLSQPHSFLLYNEERQVIPLHGPHSEFLLRNQQVLQLDKADGNTFLLRKDRDDAYQMKDESKDLWQHSDGLLDKNNLTEEQQKVYNELESEGLLTAIRFGK